MVLFKKNGSILVRHCAKKGIVPMENEYHYTCSISRYVIFIDDYRHGLLDGFWMGNSEKGRMKKRKKHLLFRNSPICLGGSKLRLYVLMPFYNDWQCLLLLLKEIDHAFQNINESTSICTVDDHSTITPTNFLVNLSL